MDTLCMKNLSSSQKKDLRYLPVRQLTLVSTTILLTMITSTEYSKLKGKLEASIPHAIWSTSAIAKGPTSVFAQEDKNGGTHGDNTAGRGKLWKQKGE